ncbi:MAG: glycosyltransferase [Pedobacter sp.]|nr:MAG: glycosyltransferase [Pedobacter sp.]
MSHGQISYHFFSFWLMIGLFPRSEKITVVGTGTGIIKPFYEKKNYTKPKILFAAKGRFKDKGGDLVLKAFFKALETLPELELSIVGQNDYSDQISHPRIKTYGFVSIEELQQLFNSHSLFLMPALNEPWGLVYIEAMLCKMPIVGLNRNSFPELSKNGEYGAIISEPDSVALADSIIRLFEDPIQLEQIGIEAQKFALANFTWENTVNKILKVMEVSDEWKAEKK